MSSRSFPPSRPNSMWKHKYCFIFGLVLFHIYLGLWIQGDKLENQRMNGKSECFKVNLPKNNIPSPTPSYLYEFVSSLQRRLILTEFGIWHSLVSVTRPESETTWEVFDFLEAIMKILEYEEQSVRRLKRVMKKIQELGISEERRFEGIQQRKVK